MNNVKIGYKFILNISVVLLTGMSCTQKKETMNNINLEISNIEIIEENKYYSNEIILEKDTDYFIPETYEEALELMDRLKIENVVLEEINIDGEIYTVVEVTESQLTIGTDSETNIYDIPDKSGNILLTLPFKNQIQATIFAIIEEPSLADWGNRDEHWVKIRMEDGTVGWVRGEYTSIDRGGIKYRTQKNIWLEENYARYWR
jgi:hypothetical protein